MPLKKMGMAAGQQADMARASVVEYPVVFVAVTVLYGMSFVDDGWDLFDIFAVFALSAILLQSGVARRWS